MYAFSCSEVKVLNISDIIRKLPGCELLLMQDIAAPLLPAGCPWMEMEFINGTECKVFYTKMHTLNLLENLPLTPPFSLRSHT